MTGPPGRVGSTAAVETAAAESKARRRVGLLLLLGGVGLVFGGLYLPWLTFTCVANCRSGSGTGGVGPLMYGGFFPFTWSWPFWLVLMALALLLAWEERLPARRRSAVPALMLAGLFLVGVALVFLAMVALFSLAFRHTTDPVQAMGLAPECAVSPLGALLFALGGWLRYHPARVVPATPIDGIPEPPPGR